MNRTLGSATYVPCRRWAWASYCFLALLTVFFPLSTAAQNFDPGQHQTPVVAMITPVLPDVMILVDSSVSMNNIIWEEGYDPGTQYPLYRYGRKGNCTGTPGTTNACSGQGTDTYAYGYINKVTDGRWNSIDFGTSGATGNNSGAWYCYRNHDQRWDYLNQSNDSYIVQSTGWIYGRKTNANNTWKSGEPWRRIKLPTNQNYAHFDNYLAYLFETYATSANGYQADLSATHPNQNRMQVARQLIADLIQRQDRNARFGAMKLNGSDGGYVYNSADPFGIVAFPSGTTNYLDLVQNWNDNYVKTWVSNLAADSSTPIGEGLYDAYDKFLSSSTCEFYCQNKFVVIVTDGEPNNDSYYPTGLKSKIDTFCNGDAFCQQLKADTTLFTDQNGNAYTASGFPWYLPCTTCRSSSQDVYKGESLIDGIAYMMNRMTDTDTNWPSKGGNKCSNVATYVVGFALNHPRLERVAKAGDGLYYTASTAEQLAKALDAAMKDIFERTFSVAGLAFSSPNYRADETKLVSTRFNSADWSGDVLRRDLSITWDDDGNVTGQAVSNGLTASSRLPVFSSRTVYTANPSGALVTATAANTGLTQDEYNFLIGDSAREISGTCPTCPYRSRLSKLGDVVDSRPAVANGMVYVGGNDGFLHAIDLDSMVEKWIFIPPQLITRTVTISSTAVPVLKHLSDPNYKSNHTYYVDLSVNVHSFNDRTYIVCGLRGGGKGFFAMDVTSPNSPSLLWVKDNNSSGWVNEGYSFSEPQLARLLDNGASVPVVIFGNGYGVTGASPLTDSLFIVSLNNGSVLYEIPTGLATGGLSTPALYAPNGWTRSVYAGDLAGNVWRFSRYIDTSTGVTPPSAVSGGWYVTKLYATGKPITAQCNIGLCQGKPLVIGGTGRYLTADDISSGGSNYIFAVKDEGTGSLVTSPWYSKSLSGGERVTTSPEIVYGRAYVVGFTPDSEPCAFGGTSNIYSFKFCPEIDDGSTPSQSDTDESSQAISHLITSNLGTTMDDKGRTAVIAEDINGTIRVLGAPAAPSGLTGWKTIRWQQATVPAQ